MNLFRAWLTKLRNAKCKVGASPFSRTPPPNWTNGVTSLKDLQGRVLQQFRERFKDDFVLFLLQFESEEEMQAYLDGLSFVENNATDHDHLVICLKYSAGMIVAFIGGHLDREQIGQVVSRCRKRRINYDATAAKESSWYAAELRRFSVESPPSN